DLKPANVMLGKYGETLVVDWGLAKRGEPGEGGEGHSGAGAAPARDPGTEAATATGALAGTPAYMSPEQAAGRWDHVGPASDIYSLGATLYEVLANRARVEGTSLHDVLDRARRRAFPPPRQVQPGCPPALEAVCLKAMAAEPRDRYATASALA